MKTFAIIGSSGFIAPRHMRAIKETGNKLVASVDKHDNVGVLDSYFPESDFFTEFERFDRHLYKLKQNRSPVDYITICSPNYLHDSHIRYSLRYGANVICEKPLVLNPWNLDAIEPLQDNNKVFTILQLRLHPEIVKLKNKVDATSKIHYVNLKYITSRGNWYKSSWKGDDNKSGGILMNIGIHLFDMLIWIFGQPNYSSNTCINRKETWSSGTIIFEKAIVNFFLSTDKQHIPAETKERSYRVIEVDGEQIEFGSGFTDLHTNSYKEILKGNGFTIEDSRPAIELVHKLRTTW